MAYHVFQLILLILLCFLASPSCSGEQFDVRLATLPGNNNNTDAGILLRSYGGEDIGLVCSDSSRVDEHHRLAILVCTELGYASNIVHRYDVYQTAHLVSYNISQQLGSYSLSCSSSSEAEFRDCEFQQTGGDCYDAEYNTNLYAGMTCVGSKITSCADRCDTRLHPHWECQCNNECVEHGDCCSDFLQYCTRPTIRDNGAVVVKEITTTQEVGYVCHGGRFLPQEALVVCKELGFMGMAAWKTLDREAASTSTVIDSYIRCYEGDDTLSDCTFATNPMESNNCSLLAGVTCNITIGTHATTTEDEMSSLLGAMGGKKNTSTLATTTEDDAPSSQPLGTTDGQITIGTHATTTEDEMSSSLGAMGGKKSTKEIIVVIVCIALCIVVALLVLIIVFVRRRRTRRKFDSSDSVPPASGPTVDMATLTANQSAGSNDDALPALTSHTPLVMAENEYTAETFGQKDHEVGAIITAGEPRDPEGDNEYAYADIPAPRSERSTNPTTLGYSDVAPAHARQERDEGDVDGSSYGMVDNILYGTN